MLEVIYALCGIWVSCKNIQTKANSTGAGFEATELASEMLDEILQKISARVITYLWENPGQTEKVFEEITNLSEILHYHVMERVQQHYAVIRSTSAITFAETKQEVAENDFKKASMILKFCSPG